MATAPRTGSRQRPKEARPQPVVDLREPGGGRARNLVVPTSQLRVGDVIEHETGMSLRLEQPLAPLPGPHPLPVYGTRASVVNAEDFAPGGRSPNRFITAVIARDRGWVVQGNDLVTWTVRRQRPRSRAIAGPARRRGSETPDRR